MQPDTAWDETDDLGVSDTQVGKSRVVRSDIARVIHGTGEYAIWTARRFDLAHRVSLLSEENHCRW